MKLKVCGMKYQDNISEIAALQPDYLGFIFYEKSARFFEGTIPELPKAIKKVGVFVDAPREDVLDKATTHNLQAVQLHGQESVDFCSQLKQFCHSAPDAKSHHENLKQVQIDKNLEIIKVFSIKNDFDFSILKPYEDVVDYFLFDTKGALPGGNGYAFDWTILNNYPSTKPYFLSGGIGLDQINQLKAFKMSKASKFCYAIDVNSKFEIEAGLKSIYELEKFKNKLRRFE